MQFHFHRPGNRQFLKCNPANFQGKKFRSHQFRTSSILRRFPFRKILGIGLCSAISSGCYIHHPPKLQALGQVSKADRPLHPNPSKKWASEYYLKQHVKHFCWRSPRDYLHYANLNATTLYIREQLLDAGFSTKEQRFSFTPDLASMFPLRGPNFHQGSTKTLLFKTPPEESAIYRNLWIEISPQDLRRNLDPPLILGAHYDGFSAVPGADDNASSVAVLLELARIFSKKPPKIPVVLAFWANGVPPLSQTSLRGSAQFAKRYQDQPERVLGVLALDQVGRFTSEWDSQRFPFPLSTMKWGFNQGNFIALYSSQGNASFVKKVEREFRKSAAMPIHSAAALPNHSHKSFLVQSDHHEFIKRGISAACFTDTGFFRHPAPQKKGVLDLEPEDLHYPALAHFTNALVDMLMYWHE